MIQVLKRISWLGGNDRRAKGLKYNNYKVFGYYPREQMRRDYCKRSVLASEDPEGHKTICEFGALLSEFYKKYCPEMYQLHEDIVKSKIKDEWVIEKSPFTSGIINKNNQLKYHFDGGNLKQVFSNMVCFRKDCSGGHLAIPEFNLGLEIADKTMLFFDGQSIMHGVTPFKMNSINGYRYTLVYYTLKQMWHCQPINEELARIKMRKTEREMTRYKRLVGQELTDEEMERQKGLTSVAKTSPERLRAKN